MAGAAKKGGTPWVTVGVCGGVAAYKAAELVRELQQRGADVHVAMTRAAEEFVRPLTFSSLTGHRTITSMWGEWGGSPTGLDEQGQIEHISEAQGCDALVIAPATAHVLAKMAHGLADDFLSTMILATNAPVIVAPAMNVNMWNHAATQANLAVLRARGVTIVEPGSGYLACGMTGAGRLAEVDAIARPHDARPYAELRTRWRRGRRDPDGRVDGGRHRGRSAYRRRTGPARPAPGGRR